MLRFFEIARVGAGTLFTGPRPRHATLNEWCKEAKSLGVAHVVSLIEDSEVTDYRLQEEGDRLNANGIAFTHFPIDDFQTPRADDFYDLVKRLHAGMESGTSILAHCAGGVGRAGTFASCMLVADGMVAGEAIQLVSQKRGEVSPETKGQMEFVRAAHSLDQDA